MYKSAGKFFSGNGSLARRAVNLVESLNSAATANKSKKSKKKKKLMSDEDRSMLTERLVKNWATVKSADELKPIRVTGKSGRRLLLKATGEVPEWAQLSFFLRRETRQYARLLEEINRLLYPHRIEGIDFEK